MDIQLDQVEIKKLKDLKELLIEDDLLDVPAYDSISRGDKIQNSWKALDVLEKIIKLGEEVNQ